MGTIIKQQVGPGRAGRDTLDKQGELWPRQRRAPAPLERRLHCSVADCLRRFGRPGWWWTTIPSGELRSDATGRLLKRLGLKPGMADMLLIDDRGRHYWLELKRARSGRMSPGQVEFRAMRAARGVPHAVRDGFTEAVETLRRWGALRAGIHPQ